MAYLILPSHWTRQPQGPVSTSIGRLVCGLNPAAGRVLDANGTAFTTANALSSEVTENGIAVTSATGSTGIGLTVSVTDHPFSCVFVCKPSAGTLVNAVLSLASAADKYARVYLYQGSVRAGHAGATTSSEANNTSVYTVGQTVYGVAVFASPTDVRIYTRCAGVTKRTATTTNVGALGLLTKATYAGYSGASFQYPFEGTISLAYWFANAFADGQAYALLDNPWQIFRPIQRRIYVPSAGTGATAYTVDADSGSFTLTGTAAGLALGRQLSAEAGSFTYTGTAAGLAPGRALTAAAGAFTLTGTAAGLTLGRQLSAEAGSFVLTGTDATLEWSGAGAKTIDAEAGAFALSGTNAGLALGRQLSAEAGSFTLTGTAATLTHGYTLVAENGNFVVTGSDATLSTTGTVVPDKQPGAGKAKGKRARTRILRDEQLTAEDRRRLGVPEPQEAAPEAEQAAPAPKRAKRAGKASRGIQLAPEADLEAQRAAEILEARTAELMAQQQAMRADQFEDNLAMVKAAAAIEADNELMMLLLMAA